MARRTVAWALPVAAAALWFSGTAAGAPAGKHVQASLHAENESVQPARSFWLGIHMKMDEGWHTYWKNPADSGLPTRMKWTLPEGFTAGPLRWPYPQRLSAPPLMSYGYEGEVLLPVEVHPPATLLPGATVRLAGRVDWLECKEACVPGRAELELTLPVRAEGPHPSSAASLFAEARRRLPVVAKGWGIRASRSAGALSLSFRPPHGGPAAEAYFFPEEPLVLDHAAPQSLRREAGAYRLELKPSANASPSLERLSGVLVVEGREGTVALEVNAPVGGASGHPTQSIRQ